MGVSVSASVLIFFISFAICFQMMFAATQSYIEDNAEAQRETLEKIEESLQTSIRIDQAVYNSTTGKFALNLTNAGSITINPEYVDVVLDGSLMNGNITSFECGGVSMGLWYPASKADIGMDLGFKPVRVMITAPNGARYFSSDIQNI